MTEAFNAVVFEERGWFVARCLEIDLASQGNTPEEAYENLKEAMRLHLQEPSAGINTGFCKTKEQALSVYPQGIIETWSS